MADYTAPDRSQLQTSADRDKVNTAMRSSPEWRNAITALGHNPDGPLKLSKGEQQSLAQQLQLPLDDFHIDPAGNINDFHGWKGLPTWAKTAIIVGAAVGTAGAAGAFSGGAGLAAGSAGVGETAATGAGGLTATSLGLPATAGLGTAGTVAGAGGGTLSTLGGLASKGGTAQMIGGLLHGGGQAAGAATNAAGQNRLNADEVAMRGQQNYENQFLSRAGLEAEQRKEALKDLYRASYAANRKAGPFNTAGLTPYSADYTAGLSAIEQQGLNRLQAPSQYGVNQMPTLKPFAPTPPSTGEKIGNYAAPAMTLGGMALDYFRNR